MSESNTIFTLRNNGELGNTGVHYDVDLSQPVLGEGNMGIVRQGVMVYENSGERIPVAIKFLFDDNGMGAIRRSEREASIRIVHENLVEMKDFFAVEDNKGFKHYHVVSELLRGVMLLDILNGNVDDATYEKYPKVREVSDILIEDRDKFSVNILRGILSGIQTLHDNRYIHRDIDPSNIMITDTGKVKLIDLGIAKQINDNDSNSENLTLTGDFVGKPAYAAPELVRGDVAHQNATTDIYAVGILLFQLLTGSLPFTGDLEDVLKMQLKCNLPLKKVKHAGLRKIIKKATEKSQDKRFRTAAEFRAALDSVPIPDSSPDQRMIVVLYAAFALLGLLCGSLLINMFI